ncbi:hypothetical protein SAMD00019534_106620, partial [Acytostelium subglobosum LB1]|uniref:hypothetical protein n=1 Tax=Acytostelium subglobosum LB1 TaxID=1410327 RepID=UPI0006450641
DKMDGYEKLQSCAKRAVVSRSVTYQDYPCKGVAFSDLSPLFLSIEDMDALLNYWQYRFQDVNLVVGLEARGFILGTAMSQRLKLPFVMLRKKGKLPGETLSESFTKEYGKDEFEVQKDILSHLPQHLRPSASHCFHVLIMDDVLATGGTLCASIELVRKLLHHNNITNFKISTSIISAIKCLKGKQNIYEKYNDVSIDVINDV